MSRKLLGDFAALFFFFFFFGGGGGGGGGGVCSHVRWYNEKKRRIVSRFGLAVSR